MPKMVHLAARVEALPSISTSHVPAGVTIAPSAAGKAHSLIASSTWDGKKERR